MKFYKILLIILVVFLKTGNVLSNSNIFDVNNIEIEKKGKTTNQALANLAIKKAFKKLVSKILLEEDIKQIETIKFSDIKELVNYYQVSDKKNDNINLEKINFNISFDKDKIHNLFHAKGISYSKITNKELFILPILKKNDQVYIYNKNIYYENWNNVYETELIEFILPLENIEIIQIINSNKDNLLKLDLSNVFKEYSKKNLAIVLIEEKNISEEKIYLKTKILGKSIVKNFTIKRENLTDKDFSKKIISKTKLEIINLIKSRNLIDIRVPSFLNVQFKIDEKNNLVEINSRLKKIDAVENIFIKEFNSEIVVLKIKYLGKLDKIIKQFANQNIILESIGDLWSIKII